MLRFIIDAETDGLYGQVLTLAVLVADEDGHVLHEFYGGIPDAIRSVQTPWVKEHVIPIIGEYQVFEDEEQLLEALWSLWENYKDKAQCYVDVAFPVESQLWRKTILKDAEHRSFNGPFPILDLSSILFAKGYDSLVPRQSLVEGFEGQVHNALDDVRLTNAVLSQVLEIRRA